MKTIVHVNQHNIRANAKRGDSGDREPVFTVKTYKDNRKLHALTLRTAEGREVEFVYSDDPLSCGARAWVQFDSDDFEVIPTKLPA